MSDAAKMSETDELKKLMLEEVRLFLEENRAVLIKRTEDKLRKLRSKTEAETVSGKKLS